MKINEKIRYLRQSENLTQAELGRKMGVTGHNIFDWEKGKGEPSLDMIKRFSEVFGVSVGYLIGTEDEDGHKIDVTMTEEEQKLLKCFRTMDEVQRRAILRAAESFYQDNAKNSRIPS